MHDFYLSAGWRELRERVLARDDRRCTVARLLGGRCAGALHVHHLQPVTDRPDLALDEDNCATTCARHHGTWEALRRALTRRRDLARCPHHHPYPEGRRQCEDRRRRELTRS